ncbi:MAG: glycoside hydrolase family 97 catalytic domain-containing protein [Luteolibacter sp.]
MFYRFVTLLLLLVVQSPGESVEIRNRWHAGGERWLGAGGEPLATLADPEQATWITKRSGNTIQLRHEASGKWLGVAEGKPVAESDPINPTAWTMEQVTEEWIRLSAPDTGTLHIENNTDVVECGPEVQADWLSAMWRLVEISSREVLPSPDGNARITFQLANGMPEYLVRYGDEWVISPSPLGFEFENAPPLAGPFQVISSKQNVIDETWNPVWGQRASIRNHGNELVVELEEISTTKRRLQIVFRAYDDGVAFRYFLPEQPNLKDFKITNELTSFRFTSDATAWWVEDLHDTYERDWNETPLSKASVEGMHTPATFLTKNETYVSIHEASLVDWASMTLKCPQPGNSDLELKAELVPWFQSNVKVIGTTPMHSPWRTIQLAERPGGLIESDLIQNLNEPSAIEDTSWIKPAKFMGIWWGMITEDWTWDRDNPGRHGATTERAKRYIDACVRHGIDALLIEGWCEGWEGGIPGWRNMNFTTPYPDFDIEEVCRYGREKGVSLIGHHETGGDIPNYEKQMEDGFALYEKLGIDRVKTGYVTGDIPVYTEGLTPDGREHHHGQFMVRHYQRVVEMAAKYHIMIDAHEPIKPTGLSRTWPNFVAREGARGGEFNHFVGNPPRHCTILPFTRLLGGPMDYTPGLFDCSADETKRFSTRANQLALYVVLWSPLQMAADNYQAYDGEPAAQFITNVPVGNWDETRVIDSSIGDYIVTARRKDSRWYLGAITNEEARQISIPLDFLEKGSTYDVVIYGDAPDADYATNPIAMAIHELSMNQGMTLDLDLRPGGGAAVEIYIHGDDVPKPSGTAGNITPSKPYRLLAKHSDQALTSNGADLSQTATPPTNSQLWIFEKSGEDTWKILQGDQVVEAIGSDNGTRVTLAAPTDSTGQLWKLEHISGTQFHVVNAASGKLLDVEAISFSNGAPIHLWERAWSPSQVWSLEPVEPTPVPAED